MINIRKITEENFIDAFHLNLAPGQENFVSHPVRSLAQAYVYREQCQPFGIYKDDTMISYVMIIYDYDIPEYDIWHMMIDKSQQNMGYGSIALDLVLDYIKTKPFGPSDRVTLTCNKDNIQALHLYKSKGFIETGAIDDEEIELSLTLPHKHANGPIHQTITDFSSPLFQKAFKQYFAELGITVNDWTGLFQEMGEDTTTSAILSTTKDGSLIGFLMLAPLPTTSWFFEETCGFIREFFIFPEFRSQGHGSTLLAAAENHFRSQKICTSILTTDTAPDFYLRHGYQRAHGVRAKNEDAVFIKHLFPLQMQ